MEDNTFTGHQGGIRTVKPSCRPWLERSMNLIDQRKSGHNMSKVWTIFFAANGIDAADRKKSMFLAVIGPTYPYTAKESRVAKQARR